MIKYSAGDGKDVVRGFGANSTLSIGGGKYSTTKSGKNLIVTVGDGKISLIGAASLSSVNITGDYLTVKNSTKSPVTVDSAVKVIDASARTKAVKITGNAKANTILGGKGNDSLYGGKGNDCIVGGKGDDSLWGDAGKDTFIYADGDGKDVICGFEDNDLLKITGTFSGTYNKSKSEVYFKVGTTSKAITLHDFTATSFNVNSDTYKISGGKLVKS